MGWQEEAQALTCDTPDCPTTFTISSPNIRETAAVAATAGGWIFERGGPDNWSYCLTCAREADAS